MFSSISLQTPYFDNVPDKVRLGKDTAKVKGLATLFLATQPFTMPLQDHQLTLLE